MADQITFPIAIKSDLDNPDHSIRSRRNLQNRHGGAKSAQGLMLSNIKPVDELLKFIAPHGLFWCYITKQIKCLVILHDVKLNRREKGWESESESHCKMGWR